MLTLREAVEMNRLPDFIAQEEARGVGPIDRQELDAVVVKLVKQPRSEDRIHRSSSFDNSAGE